MGEEGQLYISGMPEEGELQVSWGTSRRNVVVPFRLPENKDNAAIVMVNAVCEK